MGRPQTAMVTTHQRTVSSGGNQYQYSRQDSEPGFICDICSNSEQIRRNQQAVREAREREREEHQRIFREQGKKERELRKLEEGRKAQFHREAKKAADVALKNKAYMPVYIVI